MAMKFMLLVFTLMLSCTQSRDTGAEQALELDDYDWEPVMTRYVEECNYYGNAIVWRIGSEWKSFGYDNTFYKSCNPVTLNGGGFEGVTFDGYGYFQTSGWYGWQNWAFTGTWNRIDHQTVEFS